MDVAMGTDRSKALHNFTMPCDLRWGNQKFLRCKRVNSSGEISPVHRFKAGNLGSSDHGPIQQRRTTRDRERGRERDSSSEFVNGSPPLGSTMTRRCEGGGQRGGGYDDEDEIAAIREKVIFDLQAAADKMKDAILKDGLVEREVFLPPQLLPRPLPPPPVLAPAEGEAGRPWNLRTRRAACKMPMIAGRNGGALASGSSSGGGGGKGVRLDPPSPHPEFSQMRSAAVAVTAAQKSPMRSTDGGAAASSGEKRERTKFSVPLSKREIEEDFFAMVGHRPPRRPKKRARIVQKQLDDCGSQNLQQICTKFQKLLHDEKEISKW